MSIEKQLTTMLKDAMRAKRTREVECLRMVKSHADGMRTAAGFSGETDDGFWSEAIKRYANQQKKALAEFEKAGDQGAEQAERLRFELELLAPFLPQLLGPEQVRELVRAAIAETGAAGPKMVGRVVGQVMKAHRDEVDPALVKQLAAEELG